MVCSCVALVLVCIIFPIVQMAPSINWTVNFGNSIGSANFSRREFRNEIIVDFNEFSQNLSRQIGGNVFKRKFSGFIPKMKDSFKEPERNISIPFQFLLNHHKVDANFSIPSPHFYSSQSQRPPEFEMMTMTMSGSHFTSKKHVNNPYSAIGSGPQVNPRYRHTTSNSMRKVKRHLMETFNGDIFSPLRNYGLVCKLCIVMDSEFILQHGNGELSQVILKLEHVVDFVSWIFRATDWDEDGLADNIGFRVQIMKEPSPWVLFKNEDVKKYGSPKLATSVLTELAKLNFRKCCLGLGFTMRPFLGKQVGASFIATRGGLGGLCDHRSPDPLERMTSVNVVLISGAGPNPNPTLRRPLEMSDLQGVLLHELGHAFGVSNHDNDDVELKQCSGHDPNTSHNGQVLFEPPKGRFIMWGKTLQGKQAIRQHNLLFSQCSKVAVANILKISIYSSCLIPDYQGFCGNGILEDPEECDCGSESTCKETPCCGPRSSRTPCKILPSLENCSKFQRSYRNFSRLISKFQENFQIRVFPEPSRLFVLVFLLRLMG